MATKTTKTVKDTEAAKAVDATPKAEAAPKATKPVAKKYVVLEPFQDRNGILYPEGAEFPADKYSAKELAIYATAENRIGRAVVAVQ